MQRERVKPATGVPLFFEIEKLGVRTPSQYAPSGYEFRYEGAMHEGPERKPVLSYLAPEAHEAIERAGAKVGDLVRILKGRDGQYLAKVMSDTYEEPQIQQGPRIVAPSPAARTNGYMNGAAKPESNGTGGGSAISQQLSRCLIDAIDASLIAESYAAGKAKIWSSTKRTFGPSGSRFTSERREQVPVDGDRDDRRRGRTRLSGGSAGPPDPLCRHQCQNPFGRSRLEIEPVAGEGKAWVNAATVRP